MRQLAAFTAALGTAEPFALTCMSATVPRSLLGTIDNPVPGGDQILKVTPDERTGELAVRLAGRRAVRRLDAEPGDYPAIAAAVQARHRPGTLTLMVLNTVDAARQVFKHLTGRQPPGADCLLLHSRFRGVERKALLDRLITGPGDRGRMWSLRRWWRRAWTWMRPSW